MNVSFFETMRGVLKDERGRWYAVEFELKAEATRLALTGGGTVARLTGILHMPPWADRAPTEGVLTLDPLRRRIRYELRFGDEAVLTGEKRVSLIHPVRSMTEMETELRVKGTLVAAGMMRFSLRDLRSFLGSFAAATAMRRAELPTKAGAPYFRALSNGDRERIRALAEALIEPGVCVPAADDATVDRTIQLLSSAPPHVAMLFRAGLRWLDVRARLHHRRSFARLTRADRAQLMENLRGNRAERGLYDLLAFSLRTAHFGRRDYLDAIGAPSYVNTVSEPAPRWLANVTEAEALDAVTELDVDVAVIGTGAGGAVVAARLAEQGLGVAVIEEGRYFRRADFSGAPEERILQFWRDGGMNLSIGNVPILIPIGRMVGGTTAINSGTCFRTPDAVLQEWRARGFPADFAPEHFARYLDRVQAELQVQPAQRQWLGGIADVVARGADAMGVEHGPLLRNAPGCDGQGTCAFGCPTDAKRSTNVSYMPRALNAGAQLFVGLPATRLLRHGRRILAVEARGADRYGVRKTLRLRPRAVVVACGSLNSPGMLSNNGVSLPQLGRNLSIHPALGCYAMLRDEVKPWAAIPQGYGVHGLVSDRLRYEGFYIPPSLAAPTFPFSGAPLTRWMDRQASVGQFGFMCRDGSVGSVRRGLHGRPLVFYNVAPDIVDLLGRGMAAMAEMLLRGGAEEVMVGVGDVASVATVDDARALAQRVWRAGDFKVMGFHPLGTGRMAASAEEGVVDFEHRVFGTDNLYLIDGAAVPSSLGVNPQMTIMAMAERGAEILASALAH